MKQTAPYGTWPSPVSPEMLTGGVVGLIDVWTDAGSTIWLEARPAEGGRMQIVTHAEAGGRRDVLPDDFSARSGVHEYGGGAAWVERGVVWFVNWLDQRLYRLALDGSQPPLALTPEPLEPRSVRFADIRLSPDGERLVCVRERHLDTHDVRNEVVLLDAHMPSDPVIVHARSDFVMSPRFAGADRIRFIAWDHPNMPWNSTALTECTYDPGSGATGPARTVVEGASLMQPLEDLVISDRSGWWNLWSYGAGTDVEAGVEAGVDPIEAEVGGPAWVFGERAYTILDDGRTVCSIGGELRVGGARYPTDAVSFGQFTSDSSGVTAIARYADREPAIVRFAPDRPDLLEVVVPSAATGLASDEIAVATEVTYPTVGGGVAYAWFYPPTNSTCEGPPGSAPPLVTMIHGGPTSDAEPAFSIARQFWTSRGFAVVDVNHRGSTGYGTPFRDLLDGNWGIVDVEDCCAVAGWLAEQGLVDAGRMVIRGGSAGGFTVLSCLARSDVFAAGGNLFGVADLSMLAADTHKFEARYLDRLVGPWPEASEVYAARSPINHLDGFRRPLIVFQGLDDMVVPPSQSEAIVAALRANDVECEYHAYSGEGHGFRRSETIVHQLTHELDFYRRVLGLTG